MYNSITTCFNKEDRVWSGPRNKHIYSADMTLGEVVLYELGKTPERIIQIMDTTGEQLTAAELLRNSKIVAMNLQLSGLKVGDVVGICANNTPHLSAVMVGAFLCGTPTNSLYPDIDKETAKIIFQLTTPKIIICELQNYKIMREVSTILQLNADIILMDAHIEGARNIEELLLNDGTDVENMNFPCAQLTGDDTAVILCSSGTTGVPKGVCCSHQALINLPRFLNLTSDSVIFSFSSMYWASGLWVLTASLVKGVKRVITNLPSSPEYLLQLVEKHCITHILSATFHMAQLIEHAQPNTGQRLASIRSIMCGGAKVAPAIIEKMRTILGAETPQRFIVAYGLSEMGTLLSQNFGRTEKPDYNSVGVLLPNRQTCILNEVGERCGINEQGVLHLRSSCKWSGYYRNPEGTEKAYVDGWLITGDVGYFDEQGYLHICGRVNDIFKTCGFQIYPELIEEVILQMPGILEACIFGIPDGTVGHLTACAVVRANSEAGKALTAADIEAYVAQKLIPRYHINAGVYFLNTLPKTGSHKVLRRKIVNIINNDTQKE